MFHLHLPPRQVSVGVIPKMADARSTNLATALRDKTLVKFIRPFEDGGVHGYVLDIGPRWFLLALVGDGIRFNGFQCFRLSDVRKLHVPHPYASFAEAALKKRGECLPKKPRISVASVEELLLSASREFPLVTIHREKVDADVCEIGRVVQVTDGRVSLLEINPDATWEAEPNTYRLRDITRIDFGGEYEEALQLVGGQAAAE
jgi:hypothetical protein